MLLHVLKFPSLLRMNNILLIHSFIDGYLGYFDFLPIVNNAAMNVRAQIALQDPAFTSFGYIHRSEIARSYGNSIFNFLRNQYICIHTASRSGCTILHSHQQCITVSVSLHPRQHILSVFLIVTILMDVKWYLIVIWVCISLMINDVEHLFMCLLAICMSPLEKCLFKSFAHFLTRLFGFCC